MKIWKWTGETYPDAVIYVIAGFGAELYFDNKGKAEAMSDTGWYPTSDDLWEQIWPRT